MTRKQKNVILIVDDSEIWLEKLSSMLEGLDCVGTILRADNYEEAVAHLKSNPDVIFLDVQMPAKNGIELLRYIKKHFPKPKVCMVSNSVSVMMKERCKSLGANEYLDKSNEFEKIPQYIIENTSENDN